MDMAGRSHASIKLSIDIARIDICPLIIMIDEY